jgi:hypothetical protein
MRYWLLKCFTVVFGLALAQLPMRLIFAESTTVDVATSTTSHTVDQEEFKRLPVRTVLDILPMHYALVDQNHRKFQADHWMRDGYAGGLNDATISYGTPENIEVLMEGRGILDQDTSITRNDYKGGILIRKKGLGFIDVSYKEFPKYYDSRGGIYHPFTMFSGMTVPRDLELDIGLLKIETGLTIDEWPHLEFEFEREFKNGAKSRTTWGSAVESGITRKIIPSWQEIDEVVHVFGIKAEHEIKKFELHGEQRWEHVDSVNKRYEQNFGTTPDYNQQIQEPESQMMTTTVGADRWFWNEKAFSGLAYRYARIRSSEKENLRELNSAFQLQSFSNNAEQRFDARADNHMDSHTTVLNFMVSPKTWVSFKNATKAELLRNRGNSTYPYDLSATGGTGFPDGIIDQTIFSDNKNKTWRVGEDFGIRFKKIPRTALYTEFSVEEARIWMVENRWATAQQPTLAAARYASNENFNRRTIVNVLKTVGTAGINASPFSFLNATSQFRYRFDNNNYHDKRESAETTSAKSAFFDELSTQTVELETRATLRPCRWFRSSARYIVRDIDYFARTESLPGMEESSLLGNTYVLDVSVTPISEVTFIGSFTRENLATKTPAAADPTGAIPLPGFNSDVDTWLFGLDYAATDAVSINTTVSYSRADNFNDYVSIGLPLGADYDRVGVTCSIKWSIKKDVSIEPMYEFYHYGPNAQYDGSRYNAHLAGLEANVAWG